MSTKCDGSHKHNHLLGGRANDAELYPKQLLLEILRGMRDQADEEFLRAEEDAELQRVSLLRSGFPVSENAPSIAYSFARSDAIAALTDMHLDISYLDGKKTKHNIGQHFKADYFDEYTGDKLPAELFQKAIVDEIDYFARIVWDIVTPEDIKQDPQAVLVGGRWVLCNKGNATQPKVRARHVANEVNHYDDAQYFAATPPLESIRLLLSKFAQRSKANPNLKLGFLDVTKAYFHASPTRSVYVRVPKRTGLPPGIYGKLKRCCYGTRDAGALWEECCARALVDLGFTRGK